MVKQFLCNPQIYLFRRTIKEHIENITAYIKKIQIKKTQNILLSANNHRQDVLHYCHALNKHYKIKTRERERE